MKVRLPHEWEPRPYQRAAWDWLMRGGRYACICAHRRYGKDELALMAAGVLAHRRVGNYVHMLPKTEQVRKAIWTAINPHTGRRRIDEAFPMAIRKQTLEDEMFIRFRNGSTWQVAGSNNYNALIGGSYIMVTCSEDAVANPNAWGHFSPILRENGGVGLIISTPRGKNHFYRTFSMAEKSTEWYAEFAPVSVTNALTQKDLDAELEDMQGRYGQEYGRALWLQEYFCSWEAAIPGSIWGPEILKAENEGRITDVEVDATLPVHTAWDIGYTDDTAIWWYQMNGDQPRILASRAISGKDVEYFVREWIIPLMEKWDIRYGTHWLPHDAKPKRLGMGGGSVLQQLDRLVRRDRRLGSIDIVPSMSRQQGIQAARKTLQACVFDREECREGLEEIKAYHRKWDDVNQRFMPTPSHDQPSHYADAFRYLSVSWRPEPVKKKKDRTGFPVAKGVTFGEIRDKHFKKMRSYARGPY